MKYKTEVLIWTPFLLAVVAAYRKSVWLVLATVILMFILVALLPFARKRENLWLFIFCALCGIPINLFLLNEYPQWKEFILISQNHFLNTLALVEMTLIGTSIEEVIIALIGRMIWRRQYKLLLPKLEED